MNIDQLLENVSVIGATSTTGKYVSFLVTLEVTKLKLKYPDKIYNVNLLDSNGKDLDDLRKFIKAELLKIAEKSIGNLRKIYGPREDLIENCEIINEFIDTALSIMRFDRDLFLAKNSKTVFNTIADANTVNIFKELYQVCNAQTLFITFIQSNQLEYPESVDLTKRLIGFTLNDTSNKKPPFHFIFKNDTSEDYKQFINELNIRFSKLYI